MTASFVLLLFGQGCSAPSAPPPVVKLAPGDAAKHALAVEMPALLSAAIEQGTFTCVLNDPKNTKLFRVTFTPPTLYTARALIDPPGWVRTLDSPEQVRLEKTVANVVMFVSFSGSSGIFDRAIGGFEGSC